MTNVKIFYMDDKRFHYSDEFKTETEQMFTPDNFRDNLIILVKIWDLGDTVQLEVIPKK